MKIEHLETGAITTINATDFHLYDKTQYQPVKGDQTGELRRRVILHPAVEELRHGKAELREKIESGEVTTKTEMQILLSKAQVVLKKRIAEHTANPHFIKELPPGLIFTRLSGKQVIAIIDDAFGIQLEGTRKTKGLLYSAHQAILQNLHMLFNKAELTEK